MLTHVLCHRVSTHGALHSWHFLLELSLHSSAFAGDRLSIKQSLRRAPPSSLQSVNLLLFLYRERAAWRRIAQSQRVLTIRKGATPSAASDITDRPRYLWALRVFPTI